MIGRPPPFQPGERLTARRLNKVINARMLGTVGGFGVRSNRTNDEGTVMLDMAQILSHIPKHVCRFIVTEVHDDYLVCHTWDGTHEGQTNINVAKALPLPT